MCSSGSGFGLKVFKGVGVEGAGRVVRWGVFFFRCLSCFFSLFFFFFFFVKWREGERCFWDFGYVVLSQGGDDVRSGPLWKQAEFSNWVDAGTESSL